MTCVCVAHLCAPHRRVVHFYLIAICAYLYSLYINNINILYVHIHTQFYIFYRIYCIFYYIPTAHIIPRRNSYSRMLCREIAVQTLFLKKFSCRKCTNCPSNFNMEFFYRNYRIGIVTRKSSNRNNFSIGIILLVSSPWQYRYKITFFLIFFSKLSL